MWVFPTKFVIVQLLSHIQLFAILWTVSSQSPGVCSNSCPLHQWCHPTISSSVISFFSCLQSFPASGSFPMSWLVPLGGQSSGASASAPVLPMDSQGWFPLGLTGLISWLSKGFSTFFSNTTVQYPPQKNPLGTFLVVQWLRICLPIQGTWVQSLLWEDSRCLRATKPMSHNYWAHTPQWLKPTHLKPMPCTAMKSLPGETRESLHTATEDPGQPINK